MEKERFFGGSGHLLPVSEMNYEPSDHQLLQPCFLNLNWDHSMEQSSQFESALSSIVSSPSSHPPPGAAAESVVIRELIGRLGSICNSGEISPQSQQYISAGNNSTNTSCYSTPLNSPPKLNLSMMEHHHQARANLPISGNLVSPPASHLAPFAADPGFTERAARLSCFGGRNYSGLPGQFVALEAGMLSRVSSSQSLRAAGSQTGVSEIPMQDGSQLEIDMRPNFGIRLSRSSTPDNGQFGNIREESSVSDHTMAGAEAGARGARESNARKRKTVQRGKAKDVQVATSAKNLPKVAEEEDPSAKRTRSSESSGKDEVKPKVEQSSGTNSGDSGVKQGKENNSKPPEPPKQDYIHVRARRGQATDSHSLAERVRREKISERMKFLQDLVPGCNKVTGKAVMLDEIINYVQSLQRQVEFLSMKLATVNPRLDFNMESVLQKDMHQPRGSLPHPVFPTETAAPSFPFAQQPPQGAPLQTIVTNGMENHCQVNNLDATLRRSLSMQLPTLEGFGDASSQMGNFWDDDLQNVVQMGFAQNQDAAFSAQPFQGGLPTSHLKVEL